MRQHPQACTGANPPIQRQPTVSAWDIIRHSILVGKGAERKTYILRKFEGCCTAPECPEKPIPFSLIKMRSHYGDLIFITNLQLARCYIKAVGSPFEPLCKSKSGGGDADVEETDFQRNLFSGRDGNPHVPVGHKCLLTARLLPERSTLKFD